MIENEKQKLKTVTVFFFDVVVVGSSVVTLAVFRLIRSFEGMIMKCSHQSISISSISLLSFSLSSVCFFILDQLTLKIEN